jgi:hypothetical protein
MAVGRRVDDLFAGREPAVLRIYERLLKALRDVGPVAEEAKQSSIHLKPATGGSAFAGVHPRRAAVLLNIRSDAALRSDRVRKVERVSARRFHNELLLASPAEVDAEVVEWLRAAYALSSVPRG